VRICDEQGRELPRGEVGELVVRGPAVVKGYVGQPEETAALFRAGWYHTQDLARQDEDGYIYFVGRRSEMLKIGGIRVYPVEIEAALNAHPLVRDAVVVRAEERVRGEIARAIVQLEAGAEVEVRELQRWCRERLAPYAVPRLIELWTAIPRLPNGKVDKLQIMQTPFTQAPR
jgi:long-chain acyl-CoA synthetase